MYIFLIILFINHMWTERDKRLEIRTLISIIQEFLHIYKCGLCKKSNYIHAMCTRKLLCEVNTFKQNRWYVFLFMCVVIGLCFITVINAVSFPTLVFLRRNSVTCKTLNSPNKERSFTRNGMTFCTASLRVCLNFFTASSRTCLPHRRGISFISLLYLHDGN